MKRMIMILLMAGCTWMVAQATDGPTTFDEARTQAEAANKPLLIEFFFPN